MNNKISIALLTFIALGVGFIALGSQKVISPSLFSGQPTQNDTFGGDGTHSSSTVNTTSTLIISSWSTYAYIKNRGSGVISCYVDSQTAASSTVAANAGYIIEASSSANNSLCFGKALNCIPAVGNINCLASVASAVATVKK